MMMLPAPPHRFLRGTSTGLAAGMVAGALVRLTLTEPYYLKQDLCKVKECPKEWIERLLNKAHKVDKLAGKVSGGRRLWVEK